MTEAEMDQQITEHAEDEHPQYASYSELKAKGIKHYWDRGINEWGFRERIIELNNGDQYDWIPEDQIYEIRFDRI